MASSNETSSIFANLWRRLLTSPAAPRIGVSGLCYLLILAITVNHLVHPPSRALQAGNVTETDYVALRSTIYIDTTATGEAREQAARSVPEVYTPNTQVTAKITQDMANFFLRLDELGAQLQMLRGLEESPPEEGIEDQEEDQAVQQAQSAGTETEPVDVDAFEANAITELMGVLEKATQIPSHLTETADEEDIRQLLYLDHSTRDRLRHLVDSSVRERIIGLIFPEDLQQPLNDLKATILAKAEDSELSPEQAGLASLVATYFIRPNADLDDRATATARQQARDATPPVQREVRAGEIFLREGEVVEQEDLDIMAALGMSTEQEGGNVWASTLLFALVLALAFALGWVYLARHPVPQLEDSRYYLLFHTIVVIGYLSGFFVFQLFSARSDDSVLISFASLPVIAAAVLFAHYFTRLLALVVSGFLAVVVTLAAGEPAVLLPALFPSLAAGLIIRRDAPRPVMIRAIVFLPLIWVVSLLAMAYTSNLDLSGIQQQPWYLLLGLAPAPGAMILANYVLDAAFNTATISRLQEFDNQDHPLLRKLQLEAPGTWHHSMMVGLIAEAACQALGGNSHLVRVACMYHDIGKVRRPEFFIENQRGGTNVHDKYSPWLSKIIVEGHVKDGIAMAQAHGLPKELIDTVPQHHGTSVITYFFRKALAMSEDGYVNEYDYRYPGPKPQTLEAACINLADAAESSVRSLEEPTPHRIESLVGKIYEERLLDGQYDECGLALNQLEIIKKTIIDRLVGAYHARIEYPEEEELRRQLQLKRAEADKTTKKDRAAEKEE